MGKYSRDCRGRLWQSSELGKLRRACCRSLMPAQKLHLTLAVLTLRSEQDVQVGRCFAPFPCRNCMSCYDSLLH